MAAKESAKILERGDVSEPVCLKLKRESSTLVPSSGRNENLFAYEGLFSDSDLFRSGEGALACRRWSHRTRPFPPRLHEAH